MIPCYCLNCSSRLVQVGKLESYTEDEDDISYRAYICVKCKMSYEIQPTYNEFGEKNYMIVMDNHYTKDGGVI